MIRIVAGSTGEGKTKSLIDLANETVKGTKGHVVYIDGDNSHMLALHHEIRYINISEYPIDNYNAFFGFMCGVLSEDSDITEIFVDGLLKMAHVSQIESSDELIEKLKAVTDRFNVRLIASINCENKDLPDFLKEYAI
ncbi:twitching motility protein PilT [Anaerotalea alkaliphila]|uniref:Twitching motility protein PilT n=1 Tax=Anaerotalea alkaliphila TaxID=2662126 RepID=A0A7X5HWK1_9FIRM|nr:twitching motility protein PilT [Anaerotalea alkaliphila]NDL67942.1 twitching motility protein PilT [Anaerotalea alkaliphila]